MRDLRNIGVKVVNLLEEGLHLPGKGDVAEKLTVAQRFKTGIRAFEKRRAYLLKVAEPRASKEPGVGDFVKEVLDTAFPPH